jgi:hypothetical protein
MEAAVDNHRNSGGAPVSASEPTALPAAGAAAASDGSVLVPPALEGLVEGVASEPVASVVAGVLAMAVDDVVGAAVVVVAVCTGVEATVNGAENILGCEKLFWSSPT